MKKLYIFTALFVVFAYTLVHHLFLSTKRPDPSLNPTPWIEEHIKDQISQFKDKTTSLQQMRAFFYPKLKSNMLVEVSIKNNKIRVYTDPEIASSWVYCRYNMLNIALRRLKKNYPLPDVTFFLSLWDSYEQDSPFPLFVFAKNRRFTGQILIPDCFAIERAFFLNQGTVFKEIHPVPWNEKIGQLAWRGSTSQGIMLDLTNFHTISRLTLCQLSECYPNLIDAGFTLMYQGGDKLPQLERYKKDFMPFKDLIKYKYQLWIDGNSASYSDSGWRFFSNSVVLKPDSENIQWYYHKLEPGVHYVPIRSDLSDLVEKIEFLQTNDAHAEQIAINAQKFGEEYLSKDALTRYLYTVIWEYSKLEFCK